MMISYEEALKKVIEVVSPLQPQEISLIDAAGLVLSSPAKAYWDMPRCDNSAMDGFAFKNTTDGMDTCLTIVGASYAGHPFLGEVQPGQTVRITTGASLPKGTNTVVPLEDVVEEDGRINLMTTPESGQHVRLQGEEYLAGDVLAEAGTILRAGDIALLASAGLSQVKTFPRPRVAIISTGDELVELGKVPAPGQIINSNLHLLKTRLSECGYSPLCIGIGADDPATLDQLIDQARVADIIISTGGVSVGEKDLVQATLEKRDFKKVFWKVAIKPGKPVLFGMLDGKPYFGLPGNPAATAATFELFARPALKRLSGQIDVLPQKRKATLTNEAAGGGKRQSFLWCRLKWLENGYVVTTLQRQGSGQNRCLSEANAILAVPVGVERLEVGKEVEVLLL